MTHNGSGASPGCLGDELPAAGAGVMERSAVHHHVVDDASGSPREVAKEVLRLAGWLP